MAALEHAVKGNILYISRYKVRTVHMENQGQGDCEIAEFGILIVSFLIGILYSYGMIALLRPKLLITKLYISRITGLDVLKTSSSVRLGLSPGGDVYNDEWFDGYDIVTGYTDMKGFLKQLLALMILLL